MFEMGTDIVCSFDEVGVKKAGPGEPDEDMILYGWASAPTLDDDGERVLQEGLNVEPLLKKGWVNWNHRQDPDGIVGVPLVAELRERDKLGKCLYTEIKLMKSRPLAKPVWDLAKSLEDANVERALGVSLEGNVNEKSPQGVVKKATVYNLAVTGNPKNDDAPVRALLKGLVQGDESGVLAEQFRPREFSAMEQLATALAMSIQKALGSSGNVGGATQTGGDAISREGMDSSSNDLVVFNSDNEIKRFAAGSKDLEEVCRRFGNIAQTRGGKLTKSESAIYMHIVSGEDYQMCKAVLGIL